MKLKYKELPVSEAGNAVKGCGTIHLLEVKPTLDKLTIDLGLPINLNECTLGSTGKKEYSGDIDVVIDDDLNYTPVDFRNKLVQLVGSHDVSKNGTMLHIKYPIVDYNESHGERKPRTGFVQVDFNFGNTAWERFYHFSAGDNSEYKGAHRNLAIGSLCAVIDVNKSAELDSFGRPIVVHRWKYGPKGFCRVRRESKKHLGNWTKSQMDTTLTSPSFNPKNIASTLFPVDGQPSDLDSLETIIAAVYRNYKPEVQEAIWQRMASNFYDWPDGRNFIYPTEIAKYFPTE